MGLRNDTRKKPSADLKAAMEGGLDNISTTDAIQQGSGAALKDARDVVSTIGNKGQEYLEPVVQGVQRGLAAVDENVVQPIKRDIVDPALDKVGSVGKQIYHGVKGTMADIDDTIQKGHQAISEKRYDDTMMDEMLVGGTPVLMGLLTGDMEIGARVGAEQLFKQQDDRMKASAAEKKAKDAAASGKPIRVNRKMNGKTIAGLTDRATGIWTPQTDGKGNMIEAGSLISDDTYATRKEITRDSDIKMGKHLKPMKDSMGRDRVFDFTKGGFQAANPRDLGTAGRSWVKDKNKEMTKLYTDYGDYTQLEDGLEGLYSDNSLAQKASLKNFATSLERGRLSDFDMQYLQGTYSWAKNKKELIQEMKSGRLNPRATRELAEVLAKELGRRSEDIKLRRENIIASSEKFLDKGRDEIEQYIPSDMKFSKNITFKYRGRTFKMPRSEFKKFTRSSGVRQQDIEDLKHD